MKNHRLGSKLRTSRGVVHGQKKFGGAHIFTRGDKSYALKGKHAGGYVNHDKYLRGRGAWDQFFDLKLSGGRDAYGTVDQYDIEEVTRDEC
jgi:hypothetical protein